MTQPTTIAQQLRTRQTELTQRLERITKDERRADEPLDADFAEQAVERENDEVLTALDKSIRAELAQIEKTLWRLENGDYGNCEDCGDRIPPKRLAALPHATRCVACEEQHAKEQA